MEGLIKLHNTFHHIDWLNSLVKIITHLGDVAFIWLLIAFVMFWFKKTRKCSIVLVVSVGLGYVLNSLILKNIINRDRPFLLNEEFKNFILSLKMELPDESSFPSGHAFSSFCAATIIFLFYKKAGIFAYVLAFLIALSRVYLCVHYPTDVLAGMVIGSLFAVLIYYVLRLIENKIRSKKAKEIRENNVQS